MSKGQHLVSWTFRQQYRSQLSVYGNNCVFRPRSSYIGIMQCQYLYGNHMHIVSQYVFLMYLNIICCYQTKPVAVFYITCICYLQGVSYIIYNIFNVYRLLRYRCNNSKESNQMWILFTGRFIRKAYLLCRKKSLLQWMHLNLWLEFVFKWLRMLSTGCSSHWVALTG